MVKFLRKIYIAVLLLLSWNLISAAGASTMPYRHRFGDLISFLNKIEIDTATKTVKRGTKICSCQILVLQTSHRRQRNFALFAERTNRKSFASDASIANRVIEKEKRHMQSFFYDKLEVVGSFSDAIDCKSMFKRLKDKNKSLFLYDILDADIRR